jgi:hypothetical protein
MPDQSHLDSKYFIDEKVYNCPFCNRRHITYSLRAALEFDWTANKTCWLYVAQCLGCMKRSLHLSYKDIATKYTGDYPGWLFDDEHDLDAEVFHSVPTSFFTMDERIPPILRKLVTEAEGCLKMSFHTGASACARKAIYELLVLEEVPAGEYGDRIKSLKEKYDRINPDYFDTLSHLQNLTSDKVHEQSWEKWDSPQLRLVLETLKEIFQKIYVEPQQDKQKRLDIMQLREKVFKEKQEQQV